VILSNSQQDFLKYEFGLSFDAVVSMDMDNLRHLREKCFDIEVEEAVKADNNGSDVAKRGEIATELVDLILSHLKTKKLVPA